MPTISGIVIVARTAGHRQAKQRKDDRLAIGAGRAARFEQVAIVETCVFVFRARDEANTPGEFPIALIGISLAPSAREEDWRHASRRIEIVAVDIGDGDRHAILEAAQPHVQSGIAVQFLRLGIFRIIDRQIGRREGEAVDIDAAVGVIAAQVEADRTRYVNADATGRTILSIAVAFGAARCG